MPVNKSYSGTIAAHLSDFRSRGQREATNHRPPTDSLQMDQHEAALQSEAEKCLTSEQYQFDAVLTDSIRAVSDLNQKAIELQSKIEQLISDGSLRDTIEIDMASEHPSLIVVTENRMRAEVDCRGFRATNNITEQAVYPTSHIWHLAIIAVLALIETGINAFFYENAQGLLGGFTVALGVAVVNMGGALLLGIGFRYKNLVSIDKKLFGWFCLFLFFFLSIYCNSLFASFRAEYQLLNDPTDTLQLRQAFTIAAAEAKKVFVINMQFADLMSFILFGLGILLSGFAFYKGYTFDDRYPGYGARDRLLKSKQRDEIEMYDVLIQKVRDIIHRYRSDVQAAVSEPGRIANLASKRITELQRAESILLAQAEAIQRDFSFVLRAYREENTNIRATDPPAYFQNIPNLAERVKTMSARSIIEDLTNIQEKIRVLRDNYQEPLNERLRFQQESAADFFNRKFPEFKKEIETEACERINRVTPTIFRAA